MTTSSIFKINLRDIIKGLVVAALTGGLTALTQMLTLVPPHVDFKQLGIISLTSAIAYLIKNFVTDENDNVLRIGSRPKKKKPKQSFGESFGFDDYDFEVGQTVIVYSDSMQGVEAVVINADEYNDGQIVKFSIPIIYEEFETIYFTIL